MGKRLNRRRHWRSVQSGNLLWHTAGSVQPVEVRLHPFVFPESSERFSKDFGSSDISGSFDLIVHPLSLASRCNDAGTSQICQVTRNLGLALPENLDEVADAHLSAIHEVQQPEPGAVRQRSEQERQIASLGRAFHITIIYALTDMSRG